MIQFRQGDILYKKVEKLPAKREKKADGIVALGEVTGHSHKIVGGTVWDADGGLFVEATDGTEALHEEHGVGAGPENDIWNGKFLPGIYEVVRQREFVAPKVVPRTVRD